MFGVGIYNAKALRERKGSGNFTWELLFVAGIQTALLTTGSS